MHRSVVAPSPLGPLLFTGGPRRALLPGPGLSFRTRPSLRGRQAPRPCAGEARSARAEEPSALELLRFVFGVFGLYLATPVLSLADCAFVGRWAGTAQLAALGPGTALCDSSTYILSCVGVATTNLYASRRARGQRLAMRRTVTDALLIALLAGCVLALLLSGPLAALVARSSLAPEVLSGALSYIRIRALGAPLAVLTIAAQAACLGERDSVTPVVVVLFSGTANIVGDALLVPQFGVAGAAAATVAAQATGVAFLLAVLRRRQLRLAAEQKRVFGSAGEDWPSLFTVPSQKALRRFLALAAPVCVALVGKMAFMNSLAVAAAGLGTAALAAHQLAFQLWLFFCRAGDSLGSAAQAFLPAALAKRDPTPARRLVKRLARFGTIWGLCNAGIAALLPLVLSQLFTRDALVQAKVAGVAPLLGLGLLLHCVTLMLEGVLLASGRGGWLAKVYWLNSSLFVGGLLLASRRPLGLAVIWGAMVAFQVARLSEFGARVWADLWLGRRWAAGG